MMPPPLPAPRVRTSTLSDFAAGGSGSDAEDGDDCAEWGFDHADADQSFDFSARINQIKTPTASFSAKRNGTHSELSSFKQVNKPLSMHSTPSHSKKSHRQQPSQSEQLEAVALVKVIHRKHQRAMTLTSILDDSEASSRSSSASSSKRSSGNSRYNNGVTPFNNIQIVDESPSCKHQRILSNASSDDWDAELSEEIEAALMGGSVHSHTVSTSSTLSSILPNRTSLGNNVSTTRLSVPNMHSHSATPYTSAHSSTNTSPQQQLHPQHAPHRSISIDDNARALGVNLTKLDRLPLTMLYTEIHSLFQTLSQRYSTVLKQLVDDPVSVYMTQLQGLFDASNGSKTSSLKADFTKNMLIIQQQIELIQQRLKAADSDVSASTEQKATTAPPAPKPLNLPSLPSMYIISTLEPQSPGVPTHSPTQPAHHKYSHQVWRYPSPLPAATTTLAKAIQCPHQQCDATVCNMAFLAIRYWRLAYLSQVCLMLCKGFDPQYRNDQRYALKALPTTNSNLEGLRLLNIVLQAIDFICELQGSSKQASARLSLQFQRLGNTLLDRFQVQDPRFENT